MQDTANSQKEVAIESQVSDWQKFQAEHKAKRDAKGYNEVVTDDEALDILGLL